MKKETYYIRFSNVKTAIEGYTTEHGERKFGIDKREEGWCITDVRSGLSLQKGFKTRKNAVDYLKGIPEDKFNAKSVREQLLNAEEMMKELPIDNTVKAK